MTQFGRSCKRLSIEIIRAHSPQAKGRVERSNAVYQDRLVKELRLAQISDIVRANELLTGGFDDDLNRRFAVSAREATDYHRPPASYDLPSIFSIQEQRTLSANWTLSFENRIYQIESESANYSPASRKVDVRRYLDGTLHMFYREREVSFKQIDPDERTRNERTRQKKKTTASRGSPRTGTAPAPKPNHPWKTPWSTNQLMKLPNQQPDISKEF